MSLYQIKRGSVLILILVFLLSACEQEQISTKPYPLHYSDAIMGTSFTIKSSVLSNTISIEQLKAEIKQLLDEINGQMSTYQEDSELSLFNKNPSIKWQTVSPSLFAVLKEANEISTISKGAFDITVGPIINLWGFGPEPMSFEVPEKNTLDSAIAKIGFQNLLLDEQKQQIRKLNPDLYLDLSAIAKGYAVDQVGLLLEKHGIVDYMVEVGGELRLKGQNIHSKPWRIAIEKPSTKRQEILKVLPISNLSIATSGDYRNYFERDGVRYSHTIDPRTGKPVTHKLASVTILSDTAMKADGLATALMVLGAEVGAKFAEEHKIAALFIIKTNDGFVEKATSLFIHKVKQ